MALLLSMGTRIPAPAGARLAVVKRMAPKIENRGPQLLAIDTAFLCAAVIANVLRCYVRIRMVRGFGADDWLMAIATISFIAYCSCSIAGVTYGTGRHHADLSVENIEKATNRWWYCYLFYCTSMITSKVSIGWFLLRIAVKKLHSWIIYMAIFISVVAGGVFFFVTLFQCAPVSYFWNKRQSGTCINIEVIIGLAYLYSAFSVISDFTFAILPAFLVWNLQLKRRTKIALIPLLTMGCIASGAVVARMPYLILFRSPDFLWATLDIAIWSTVEQGLAITAGSLATLRPLFQLASHKLGLSTGPLSKRGPSRYGIASSGPGQKLSSSRKPSHDVLDRYQMSNLTEVGCSKEKVLERQGDDRPNGTPNWYQSKCSRKKSVKTDAESERSLQTSDVASVEDGMRIVVSKSFFVSDQQK